jgi:recombination protein RecT
MATGTEIVTREAAAKNIRALMDKSRKQFEMALPKHMGVDRLLRIAMTSIQRTPELLDCDPKTLIGAIMQSAQLGLEPDGVLGHAYLVPFNNRKKGRREVQLIPGYKGLIDLARRSGAVLSIQAHVINEKDTFEFEYGLAPKLRHVPTREADPGQMVGVYAVAHLRDADPQYEVMWKRQIDAIRARSRSGDSGPWVTDYDEMARKTVLRRLSKFLPMSVELATAVALDERAEAGIPQEIEFTDLGEADEKPAVEGAQPKGALGGLTEKLAAEAKDGGPLAPKDKVEAESRIELPTAADGADGELAAVKAHIAALLSETWAKRTKVARPTATGWTTAVGDELKSIFPNTPYVTVDSEMTLDQAVAFREWLMAQKKAAEGASAS